MKKISIIGATIIGNRGAEAMLTATIGRIKEKYPDSEYYIYSYYPDDDRKLLNIPYVNVHSATPVYLSAVLFPLSLIMGFFNFVHLKTMKYLFPKSIKDLYESDVLIDISGVSFMDGREIFLPFNILTIWPAMLMKVPVVKFSQGLGPFEHTITKVTAKYFLSKCKQIFARGEITGQYLKDIFPTSNNYQFAADVAFSHVNTDSLSKENTDYCEEIKMKLISIRGTDDKIIGICPSSVVFAKSQKSNLDYVGKLVHAIVELLKDESIHILLFPNATREKNINTLRNNDLPVIDQIVNRLFEKGVSRDRVTYITKDLNTGGIKSIIQYCDITVVSRFHAMIASLLLAKPVMVLGWSHKYFEVMKQFDMQQWVMDYQSKEANLVPSIFEILENKELLQERIVQKLPVVKQESFKQFEYIFREVLK